jgi:predicted nuclease of predicted toxin-antitoxin system
MIRLIIDESTGSGVAKWLKSKDWEVFSVYDKARGWSDIQILEKANREKWVVVTNDKDFGDLSRQIGASRRHFIASKR